MDFSDAKIAILDVRTREEFEAGHLEGARLIDYNGGEVEMAIPLLDPELGYLVYCRIGLRSGLAVQLMSRAGFSNVTNLGSLEDAAEATGLPVVR